MSKEVLIFGHRGIPAKCAENSLEGFKYAIEHRADGIEFDVHLTKDQIPVVMHDEKIDRTTDGTGFIKDYTSAELQQFHLSNGEKIPRLDQLLALVENHPIHLNLEFKTNQVAYQNIEAIVLNLVKHYNLTFPVIYSSFNLTSLAIAYLLDPTQNYNLLLDHLLPEPDAFVAQEHLSGLHLNQYDPNAHCPQRIWTIDDRAEQKKLLQVGADIITNNFEAANQLRQTV